MYTDTDARNEDIRRDEAWEREQAERAAYIAKHHTAIAEEPQTAYDVLTDIGSARSLKTLDEAFHAGIASSDDPFFVEFRKALDARATDIAGNKFDEQEGDL